MKCISQNKERITSIDALRAFALFGILLVHTVQLYNFDNAHNSFPYFTLVDDKLRTIVLLLLEGKCRIIFSILFGISFYLILRNPNYSRKKFCWRCILLIGFGLFNKCIYTTDILAWYGVNGLILAILPIHNLKPKHLLILSIVLLIAVFQPFVNLSQLLFPNIDPSLRYLSFYSLGDIITYPFQLIIASDIHIFWANGTETLAYFVFGYFLGRGGYIERIDSIVTLLFLFVLLTVSFATWTIYKWVPHLHLIWNISTAFFYAAVFVYIHKNLKSIMYPLHCFGKMGLTNYSLQNLLMPAFIILLAIPCHLSLVNIFLVSIIFYCIQIIFSMTWLKWKKFGPWEYTWRTLTNIFDMR